MASFAQVVKHQRQTKGKGVIGSLASAAGQKALEKIDPRNYMFDREGTLASLFPGLRGHKATSYRQPSNYGSGRLEGKFSSIDKKLDTMIERLDTISASDSLIAKNSLSLPKIERSIGSVVMGMSKLIDVIAPKESEAYRNMVKDREALFETQVGKDSSSSVSPQKVEGEKIQGSSFFGDLVKGLLVGGLGTSLMAGILEYFTNEDFKKSFNDLIGGLFGDETKAKVTEGFNSILNSIKQVWDEHWGKIIAGFAAIEVLTHPIGTLTKVLGAVGSGGLIGAFSTLLPLISGLALLLKPENTQSDEQEKSGIRNSVIDYRKNKAVYDEQFRDKTLENKLLDEQKTLQERIDSKMNQRLINTSNRNISNIKREIKKLDESYIISNQFKTPQYKNPYIQKLNDSADNVGRHTPLDPSVEYKPTSKSPTKMPLSEAQGLTASIDPTIQPAMGSLGKNIDSGAKRISGELKDGSKMLTKVLDDIGVDNQELRDRIFKVAWLESTLDPTAIGPDTKHGNARGLMQILPSTGRELGYSQDQIINDPYIAAKAGVEYFIKNYNKFNSLDAATVAHHAGPNGKAMRSFIMTGSAGGAADVNMKTDDYLSKISGSSITEGASIPQSIAKRSSSPEHKPKVSTFNDIMGQIASAPQGSFTSELLNKMWGKPGPRQQIEEMKNDIASNQGDNPQPVVIMPRSTKTPPQQPQQIGGPIASVVDEDFIKKLVDSSLVSFA